MIQEVKFILKSSIGISIQGVNEFVKLGIYKYFSKLNRKEKDPEIIKYMDENKEKNLCILLRSIGEYEKDLTFKKIYFLGGSVESSKSEFFRSSYGIKKIELSPTTRMYWNGKFKDSEAEIYIDKKTENFLTEKELIVSFCHELAHCRNDLFYFEKELNTPNKQKEKELLADKTGMILANKIFKLPYNSYRGNFIKLMLKFSLLKGFGFFTELFGLKDHPSIFIRVLNLMKM